MILPLPPQSPTEGKPRSRRLDSWAVIDLNSLSLTELFQTLTSDGSPGKLLALARQEDLADAGDVTTASIVALDDDVPAVEASIVARQAGVIAGLAAVPAVIEAFSAQLEFVPSCDDGAVCEPGRAVARLVGALGEILPVERTLLNLVGRLCGIATLTRKYVEQTAGTRAVICETRKTTPGLRALEKYAVRCGGGTLHRLGLHDAALYKDNHLAHLPLDQLGVALAEAIQRARSGRDLRFVQVEVDTLDQLDRVLGIEPGLVDMVLLDNMTPDTLARAVTMRDAQAPSVQLEASGGVSLATVRQIAETGVDRISIGALTHSVSCLDIGLDIA